MFEPAWHDVHPHPALMYMYGKEAHHGYFYAQMYLLAPWNPPDETKLMH